MENYELPKLENWLCVEDLFSQTQPQIISIINLACITQCYTVYLKSFEGENFHGFHGFLLTVNVLPLKFFLECWRHPLTTQSMVSPGPKFPTVKVFPTY